MKRVLVACEFSGVVRDAFISLGHDAISCDLLPTQSPGPHIQADVLSILDDHWDLMIAHPPCTHLACSGSRWFGGKVREQEEALQFFLALLNAPIPQVAIENPVGVASTRITPSHTQIIQPYYYGDPEKKTTCLWLRGLPPLEPTNVVSPTLKQIGTKQHPSWHTSWRDNPITHSVGLKYGRGYGRSITFSGIAAAMAQQWGSYIDEFAHCRRTTYTLIPPSTPLSPLPTQKSLWP